MRITVSIMLALGVIAISLPSLGQEEDTRVWKDRSGRELEAGFLYLEKGQVGLRLPSGREAAVGLDTLSQVDQDYVFQQSVADVFEFRPTEMPLQVKVEDSDISVSGGPSSYETKWFRFDNDETISRKFVQEAAQIFEATREAVQALPLGLKTSPPDGLDKFRAQFVTKAHFERFLKNSPEIKAPKKIAGVYDPKLKSIIVPYDQLGARKTNGHMTLLKTSDTSTLIHEITHQVMHDRLPLAPIWFSEGFAEYMASIPYHDGMFDFEKASLGVKNRLRKRYGSHRVKLPPLEYLLEMSRSDWKGQSGDYLSALVYTFYFMHLDQPHAPGSPLAAYLFLLDRAEKDTNRLITSYNGAVHLYNKSVIHYNSQIVDYRENVTVYQSEVKEYNSRVDLFNAQITEKVASRLLVKLGPKPTPPTLPLEPKMPEILNSRPIKAPVDLFQIANDRARSALLRARDYETIQNEMISKFARLGIEVSFRR